MELVNRIKESINLNIMVLELRLLCYGDNHLQLFDFSSSIKRHCLHRICIAVFDVSFIQICFAHSICASLFFEEHMQTSFQALTHCSCAACHHALHDDHEEDQAHILLAIPACFIIGFGDIGTHQLIKLALKRVPLVPMQLD